MPSITSLLSALDERTIAQRVGLPHDEARMRYPLRSNTVSSFEAFSRIIGDYYNHHFTECISNGGALSSSEATARAKDVLVREYRRQTRDADIVTAYNDANTGTQDGLRGVLDKIAGALKAESVEMYIREVFDRHVAPNVWEDKVAIIRQFISQCPVPLGSSICADQPERYARDFQELIRAYSTGLQRTSSIARRL